METQTTTPAIGHVTGLLLQSLREVAKAHALYYEAWETAAGEEAAERAADKAAPLFNAVRDYLQGEIAGNVTAWAADFGSSQI